MNNKLNIFIIELEKFITLAEAGKTPEEIKLEPLFFKIIENLSKLDKEFSIENGMDLRRHLITPEGNIKENGILLSEELKKAIELS